MFRRSYLLILVLGLAQVPGVSQDAVPSALSALPKDPVWPVSEIVRLHREAVQLREVTRLAAQQNQPPKIRFVDIELRLVETEKAMLIFQSETPRVLSSEELGLIQDHVLFLQDFSRRTAPPPGDDPIIINMNLLANLRAVTFLNMLGHYVFQNKSVTNSKEVNQQLKITANTYRDRDGKITLTDENATRAAQRIKDILSLELNEGQALSVADLLAELEKRGVLRKEDLSSSTAALLQRKFAETLSENEPVQGKSNEEGGPTPGEDCDPLELNRNVPSGRNGEEVLQTAALASLAIPEDRGTHVENLQEEALKFMALAQKCWAIRDCKGSPQPLKELCSRITASPDWTNASRGTQNEPAAKALLEKSQVARKAFAASLKTLGDDRCEGVWRERLSPRMMQVHDSLARLYGEMSGRFAAREETLKNATAEKKAEFAEPQRILQQIRDRLERRLTDLADMLMPPSDRRNESYLDPVVARFLAKPDVLPSFYEAALTHFSVVPQ